MTKAVVFGMLVTFLVTPAAAQDGGRSGIAFVQAPEMSSGVCAGENAASAFSCAKKQCIDGGGTDTDCVEMTYCFPALHSVQVSILHNEGIHWQEFYCGWDSRQAALDAAKLACDREKRPFIADCVATAVYDEDGNREDLLDQ